MYFTRWPTWLRSPGPEHSRASFVLQILLHHRQRAEILVAYGAHDHRSQKREHTRRSRCRGAIDPPCGASLTAGTLSSAIYTQTVAYDALDRLTSGLLGSYTYGNSAHRR